MARSAIALSVVLFLLLVLAYSNHFDNGFHFDDAHTIQSNGAIQDLRNLPRFFTDATTFSSLPSNQAYRPVVTTLNAVDYRLGGGLRPFAFHLSIFVAYLLLLVVMFILFRRIFDLSLAHRWSSLIAILGVAFYGLHAANAETINYIISRSDSFSTLCVLAAFVLYQMPRVRRTHAHLVPMVVGILTKQTGVMFAPLLVLYVLVFEEHALERGRSARARLESAGVALRRAAPALIITAGLFWFTQHHMTPPTTVSTNTTVGRFHYLVTQAHVISHYLTNFLLPVRLSADPDFTVITDWKDPRVLRGAFVIVVLLVVALFCLRARRTSPIGFGILWFFVSLAPTSSIVPLYQIANDHRTFFPYVGLVLAVAGTGGLLAIRRERSLVRRPLVRYVAMTLVALVLLGHAWGTYQRNRVWGSEETLWLDVTRKSPGNARGLMNYGLTQMEAGKLSIALDYYQRAIAIWPEYPYLHVNLGIVKNALGNPAEAEEHFRNALRFGRDNPEVYYYYAQWLRGQERSDEAIGLLEQGLRLSPRHVRIGRLIEELRGAQTASSAGAIPELERTVRENPTADGFIELSLAYYRVGRYRDCIDACRKALEIEPDLATAYNNICSAHAKLEEWDEGEEACEKALEIDPAFERARANLAWVRGSRDKAAKTP